MTLSGKAPIADTLLEEGAWGAAAAAAAAGGGGGGGGGGNAAAQAAAAAAAAQAAALARRWSLAFHPEFSIAGVQPTLMLPQVCLCVCMGWWSVWGWVVGWASPVGASPVPSVLAMRLR